MSSGNFGYGFGVELDKLIEKRLLAIENLEERKQTKDIMKEVFQEITHYTRDAYQGLERKLEQQLYRKAGFVITTGIIERNLYDVTNDEMFPMYDEDVKETTFIVNEFRECLQEKRNYFVYSIFVEADYTIVKQLICGREHFSCRIRTQDGEYKGSVYVELQKKYFQLLNNLFELCQLNGIEWRTVCAPYLYKIFDVYMDSADIPEDEEIEEIIVDFKEYEPYVRYNMIPIWNVQKIQINADIEPIPCVDQIHYRHIVNNRRFNKEEEYLVAEREMQILEINREEKIEIITKEKNVNIWNFYKIVLKHTRMYNYPLMSNVRSGAEKGITKTLAGIHQFMSQLGYEEYIILRNISFPKQNDGKESYSMENYIENEIKIPKTDAVMQLEFISKKQECYLVKDIMSYFITAIQREFREYKCVGTLE